MLQFIQIMDFNVEYRVKSISPRLTHVQTRGLVKYTCMPAESPHAATIKWLQWFVTDKKLLQVKSPQLIKQEDHDGPISLT